MIGQQEDVASVDADALEDTVSVEQAVVENADGGLVGGDQRSVDVDAFGHVSGRV